MSQEHSPATYDAARMSANAVFCPRGEHCCPECTILWDFLDSCAPSEIAPNVLEALQTINEMACYACEEDIDSRYAMLLRIGETARAILNAAPQASPSVAPAVHVGPAVAAPASAPSATPRSGWEAHEDIPNIKAEYVHHVNLDRPLVTRTPDGKWWVHPAIGVPK